jgi:hypothetical protein
LQHVWTRATVRRLQLVVTSWYHGYSFRLFIIFWRWSLLWANCTKLNIHKRLYYQCRKLERKQPGRNKYFCDRDNLKFKWLKDSNRQGNKVTLICVFHNISPPVRASNISSSTLSKVIIRVIWFYCVYCADFTEWNLSGMKIFF